MRTTEKARRPRLSLHLKWRNIRGSDSTLPSESDKLAHPAFIDDDNVRFAEPNTSAERTSGRMKATEPCTMIPDQLMIVIMVSP